MRKAIKVTFLVLGALVGIPVLAALAWFGVVMYGLDTPSDAGPRVADPETARTISSGLVVGYSPTPDMHVWTGIPYAGPVGGVHRWTMPQAPEPWTGQREFTEQPPYCPQFSFDAGAIPEKGYIGEENCLTLDVYAPAAASADGTEKRPVMVWLHGGGNTLGAAGDLTRNKLVTDGDIVLVAIQYRLGPLGFFSHAAIRDAGVKTANFGLEDQILALKWVQENIASFGGDPANVTLFGESAGAVNIFSLILSERARGLFHKTIMQSGSSTTTPRATAENSAQHTQPGHKNNSTDIVNRWLVRTGMAENEQAAAAKVTSTPLPELLSVMRDVPTLDLLKAYMQDGPNPMYPLPASIRDGFTLPEGEPADLIMEQGRFNAAPGIFGTNRDELGWAFLFNDKITSRNAIKLPTVDNFEHHDAVIRYTSELWKFVGADRPAAWLHAANEQNIFVYRFDWDEEPSYLGRDLGRYVGAAHTFEIPFVFGQFHGGTLAMPKYFVTRDNAPGRHALSAAMRKYWAAFAHTGVPGESELTDDLPTWTRWSPVGPRETMVFDTPAGGGPRMADARVDASEIRDAFDTDPALNAVGRCAVAGFLVAAGEWKPEKFQAYRKGACVSGEG
ncbi:carboxylesterase/lipase family protein [Kordiimonas sp.]|uniref:carboxylesterase/lipase family protein n=1 Tax=Kordiimonas sp. TaxID=1970157 RepID=UPI003A93A057